MCFPEPSPCDTARRRESSASSSTGSSGRAASLRASPSLVALDLSTLSSRSLRTAGSISSRSVRRRDVIQRDEGKPAPVPLGDEVAGDEVADGPALVLRPSSPPPLPPAQPPQPVYPHHRHLPPARARGADPKEVVRDRSAIPFDGTDPPGEATDDRPFACRELVPFVPVDVSDDDGGSGGGSGVRWADPRNAAPGRVDYAVLRRYDLLAGARSCAESPRRAAEDPPADCAPAAPPPSSPAARLLQNPRIRIATVSAGYKTAAYFVREDLDTRIYFHGLEHAVSYMARRGYVRMGKEEEEEWRELLQKAHGVVKVKKDKKKQRYRKGKLVLVLKKTITDDNEGNTSSTLATRKKQHRHCDSGRRQSSRKKKPFLLENGDSTPSHSRKTSDHVSADDSFSGTSRTSYSSVGRSVRQGYPSYSKRFLAEQEEHKRRLLLAMAEGKPLPNPYDQDDGAKGRMLLLTDGRRVSVDPSGDQDALPKIDAERANVTFQMETTAHAEEDFEKSKELGKSFGTLESNRKGVYGGGIKYFRPHSEEESSEGSDSYEEEEVESTEDFYEEEEEESAEDSYEAEVESTISTEQDEIEVRDGSDMGSLFSETEEESHYYKTPGGVESVNSTLSTGYQNEMLMCR